MQNNKTRGELTPFFKGIIQEGTKRHAEITNRDGAFDYKLAINPTTGPPSGDLTAQEQEAINNLAHEISILNYQQYPLPSDPIIRKASIYFRSSTNKRMIAGYVTIRTIQKKLTTQKDILNIFPFMKKGNVSKIFKDCVDSDWFTVHDTVSSNIKAYRAGDLLVESTKGYVANCGSFRDRMRFTE